MKAAVLLSGGIDSTTCLAMAVKEFGADNVIALNMHYGQKHVGEVEHVGRRHFRRLGGAAVRHDDGLVVAGHATMVRAINSINTYSNSPTGIC